MLDLECVDKLIALALKPEDLAALDAYEGDGEDLVPTERFVL